jgi:hypothetical protein
MWTWLKKFFMDETAFVGLIRGLLLGTGAAVEGGYIDLDFLPNGIGIALMAIAGFVRAGDKNPK